MKIVSKDRVCLSGSRRIISRTIRKDGDKYFIWFCGRCIEVIRTELKTDVHGVHWKTVEDFKGI